ncbi:MAG: SDR family oxidoreductase [Acidobacteria bacterium]|jgi:NAD(P)-dependent dehydrogenase (short-subunit alcohol dehydrogenase family)|nr:MAG: SDR family oxidoreductase [Acidobacteriota bacterium]
MSKRAIVTGGSKGIGRAIVERLLRDGWSVCTCSRSEEGLRLMWEELERPGNLFYRACNVEDKRSAREFVNFCVEKLGKIDLLVNNAAMLGERKPIEDYTEEVWDEVIRVNINGLFYITKYALPYVERGGVIVNMSSGAGKRPAPYWGAYAVSKFGVEGFSMLLAEELRRKDIRVYALNPGATRTRMRAQAYPQEDPTKLKPAYLVADFLIKLINSNTPSGSSVDYNSI